MKRAHKYKITVEYVEDRQGNTPKVDSLRFNVLNHDEILSIVKKLPKKNNLNHDSAAAFGIGLKLFGEVLLQNKDNPYFAEMKPHFSEIMKKVRGKQE